MKNHLIWPLAIILATSQACTSKLPHTPHTDDAKALLKNPKTAADHAAVAAHYEADAELLRQKAEEHKKILADFLADPHDYPKTYLGGNFKNHCKRLIDLYSRAADESLQMAKMHRLIASGTK